MTGQYINYLAVADAIVRELKPKHGDALDVISTIAAIGAVAGTIGVVAKNSVGVREMLTRAYDDAVARAR